MIRANLTLIATLFLTVFSVLAALPELNPHSAEDLSILFNPVYQTQIKNYEKIKQDLTSVENVLSAKEQIALGEKKAYWDQLISDLEDPDADLSKYFQSQLPLTNTENGIQEAEKAALILMAKEKSQQFENEIKRLESTKESKTQEVEMLRKALSIAEAEILYTIDQQRMIYQARKATESMAIMKKLFLAQDFSPELTCTFFTKRSLPLSSTTEGNTKLIGEMSTLIPSFCQPQSTTPEGNKSFNDTVTHYQGKSYEDIPLSDLFLIYTQGISTGSNWQSLNLEQNRTQLLKDIKFLVLENEARKMGGIAQVTLQQIQMSCTEGKLPDLGKVIPKTMQDACKLSASNAQEYLPYLSLPLMMTAIMSNEAHRQTGDLTAHLLCSFYTESTSLIPESQKYNFSPSLLQEQVPNTTLPPLPYNLNAEEAQALSWFNFQGGDLAINISILGDPTVHAVNEYYSSHPEESRFLPLDTIYSTTTKAINKLPIYQGLVSTCERSTNTLFGLPIDSFVVGKIIQNKYFRIGIAETDLNLINLNRKNCYTPESLVLVQTLTSHQYFASFGPDSIIVPGSAYRVEKIELKNGIRYIYLTEIIYKDGQNSPATPKD